MLWMHVQKRSSSSLLLLHGHHITPPEKPERTSWGVQCHHFKHSQETVLSQVAWISLVSLSLSDFRMRRYIYHTQEEEKVYPLICQIRNRKAPPPKIQYRQEIRLWRVYCLSLVLVSIGIGAAAVCQLQSTSRRLFVSMQA